MRIMRIYLDNWYLLIILLISTYFIFFDDLPTGLWGIVLFILLSIRMFYILYKIKNKK